MIFNKTTLEDDVMALAEDLIKAGHCEKADRDCMYSLEFFSVQYGIPRDDLMFMAATHVRYLKYKPALQYYE